MTRDDTLRIVEEYWDREVEAGCGFTLPALDLTRELVERYVAGESDGLPGIEDSMEPRWFLDGVAGKDVLCLASGGGQQSAVFGLLGANVTALDLCEGQLRGDRAAAEHYGYEIRAVKGDACDLSCFADESFDLVYQAPSIAYMPDVRAIYREVHRVLRPGGLYRVVHDNPAVYPACFEGGRSGWDGTGYRIADPYRGGPVLRNAAGVENMEEGTPSVFHRHLFVDIFGGLLELGFIIRHIAEDSCPREAAASDPGTWPHMQHYLGWFINVVAEKGDV